MEEEEEEATAEEEAGEGGKLSVGSEDTEDFRETEADAGGVEETDDEANNSLPPEHTRSALLPLPLLLFPLPSHSPAIRAEAAAAATVLETVRDGWLESRSMPCTVMCL